MFSVFFFYQQPFPIDSNTRLHLKVGSAPKLLFWLEVEQTKSTPGLNNAKSTTLEKFIVNDGALLISEIGLPREVVEFTIRLWVKGEMPGAVVFSTAQALVKYELLVVWYPRFQNSPSYAAMVDHLCNTYPLNLSQLLMENRVRGPGTDGPNQSEEEDQGRLLRKFLSCERDVPPEVSWALKIWKVIVMSLRPLCASVYKALSERGPEQSSQFLSHLIDELTSFKNMVLKQGAGSDPDIQRILKCIQLLDAAAKPHPVSGARLGVNVVSGAVNMVSEGLLRAQQQANHLLTTQLIPVLRSSSAFVEFVVEEGLSNQCAPLRAYLRVLTGMQDNNIQKAVYFPRMVTTDGNDVGGSYQFYITCPTCRPSSSCSSPFGYLLETNNLRPDLFCIEEGNTMSVLNNPESVVSMIKKEGCTIDPLSTLLPPQLVLCFSVCTQRRMIGDAEPDTNTSTGGLYRIVYKKEMTRDNKDEGDCSSSANTMHAEGKNNVEHYFETNVTQLSHIYLANVVRQLENQTENDPPLAHIQNPAASSGQGTSSRPAVVPSYLGSGVFPTDTDNIMKKQKEIDDNLQELLVSTSLLNQLPGYCLPSAIAVVGTQSEKTTGNQQNSSVSSSPLPEALRLSIHHFLLTTLPKPTVGKEEERYCCGSVEYDTKRAHTLYGTCRTEWKRSFHNTEEDLRESEHVWLPHCMVMVMECPLVDTMDEVLMTYFKEEDHDQSPHRMHPLNSSSGTVSSTDDTVVQEEVDIQQQEQQQLAKLTLITNTQGNIPSKWNFYSAPIPALDYSICIIFKLLSPQHVLAVLQWLALERSVVVTASSYNVVFSSCEAFRALLHPLKWQYRYAPFLPSNEICQFATSGLLKEKDFDLLSPHPELLNNDPLSKRATTRGSITMDNDPFLVGVDSSLLSLVLECDDIELRMRGKGCDEKVIIPGGQENASGSLRPIFGIDRYENTNNSIRVDPSTRNVVDNDEDTTQPSNDTLYLMWHLASQALIVDLDFDELTPPSIIVKRNDSKQLSPSSSFGSPSSLFPPPPLSDPESLYFPSTLLNSTLQSIQGALFVERKTFDDVKCRRPIGIDSSEEDDEKQSGDERQRLRQMRLNDENSLVPGSEEYIIKAHTCSAANRALRGAVLEMWQSLLGDMKMFLSLDGELGICRLDSERYFSLKSEWLTRRGCSLLAGLFETQTLICLLRDELLYSIPPPFASNALAKWKTAVDDLR